MADEMTPKKKRRFAFGRVNVLVTGLAVAFIALFLLIAKRPEISELEKRRLAEFPEFSVKTLLNGEFASGLHEWYVDTVPNRDGLQLVGADILALKGFHPEEGVIHGYVPRSEETEYVPSTGPVTDPPETEPVTEPGTEPGTEPETEPGTEPETLPGGETEPGTEPATEPETEPATEPETEPVIIPETDEIIDREKLPEEDEGLKNGILVYKKRAINFYWGSLYYADRYVNALEQFYNDLGGRVNVWSMTTPTGVAYYLPDKYNNSSYTQDQKEHIDYIAARLKNARNVDVYGALARHKNEDIFFRTDHHWAPLGAYYAAQEFAKTAGVPFADLSQYQECVIPNYVGSMYMYTNYDPTLKKYPDDIVYHKPQNNYECWFYNGNLQNGYKTSYFRNDNTYCVFIGSDMTVVRINTDVKNGRKLMIIKDSYGNALAPYLINSFEEIWVVDMRYVNVNPVKIMKEYGTTDLIFCTNLFSCCSDIEKYIDYIRSIPYTLNLPETAAPAPKIGEGGKEEDKES